MTIAAVFAIVCPQPNRKTEAKDSHDVISVDAGPYCILVSLVRTALCLWNTSVALQCYLGLG